MFKHSKNRTYINCQIQVCGEDFAQILSIIHKPFKRADDLVIHSLNAPLK